MTTYVYIKADTNDADYVTSLKVMENEEDWNNLVRIAEIIKKCPDRHNWPTSEYSNISPEDLYKDQLSGDDFNLMQDYVPFGEYGIHTIIEIKFMQVESEVVIYEK